ncbi:MAG: hypothetical protein IKQ39_00005 [Oscillospiraceae bacterium]|nr:hypothetical protein [Oscillospiraceae bacterium]
MIDRIDVVPVNRTEMKLEVKLKTSASADISYIRSGERYGRRSGHITKLIGQMTESGMKKAAEKSG